jgi:hypothetical protein
VPDPSSRHGVGLLSVVHGLAVVAIANRYSHALPGARSRAGRLASVMPLVLPALLLVLLVPLLGAVVVGLVVTVAAARAAPLVRAVRSSGALVAGRLAVAVAVFALPPGTISDLRDVVDRADDGPIAVAGE